MMMIHNLLTLPRSFGNMRAYQMEMLCQLAEKTCENCFTMKAMSSFPEQEKAVTGN